MNETHHLHGSMDGDSPGHDIGPGFHQNARNLIFRGIKGEMRAESAPGTTPLPNPFLPVTGVNLCLGCWYDPINQQLYDFNYNSLGQSGIYMFGTQTKTWQRVIQVGINTVGDPLGFSTIPGGRINSAAMIYGDPVDGNILFFLNSTGVPMKINTTRFIASPPVNITSNYLQVIKAPPIVPPRVTYENDTTVNANNLTNSLFQFAETFLDADHTETVLSSGSIVALPPIPFSNTLNTDKSKGARIAIYLQTGDQTVTKLRIYMRQTQSGVTGGWFIVDTIDKVGNNIGNNTYYRYLFYNSGNFIPADPGFTSLLYDFVPQFAGCQELINGDTISYAALTEGYGWFQSNFSSNLSLDTVEADVLNGVLFFADFDGTFTGAQPNVRIHLTGTGTNDPVTGRPLVLDDAPTNFYVRAQSNGVDISFFTANAGGLIIGTVLGSIGISAVSAGWVIASTGQNFIQIYYPTGTMSPIAYWSTGRVNSPAASYQLALYPQSNYSYGVGFYDAYGRTNGAITDASANISTLPYNGGGLTNVILNLNGVVPPIWAVYCNILRTTTLTYGKHTYWISNAAYSTVGQLIANQYAYIGISNMADYNIQIQATQGVVGYEFTPGDRIRILGRYAVNGTFTNLSFDYAILGLVPNPVINGTAQTGNFIQIAYPAADINANFNFYPTSDSRAPDFQDYFILLYSVTTNTQTINTGSTSGQGNVYYEIGRQYFIGNQGLNTAFIMGNYGVNQIVFNDGDIFARQRSVPTGNTYYVQSSALAFSGLWYTPIMAPLPAVTTTSSYTVGAQVGNPGDPYVWANFPTFASGNGLFFNSSANPISVRLRGSFTVSSDFLTWVSVVCKIIGPSAGQITTAFILAHSDPVGTGTTTLGTIDITFDGTVTVPAGWKLWFILGNGEVNAGTTNTHYSSFQMRLDTVNNININIFEPSFSDVYNIQTNNNSRPLIQDTTAKTTYYSTLFRYSLAYQVGTNINNTNRFYPNNFDEFEKTHGDVIRMRARQRELRIFQKRRTGRTGVYAKFIKNNAGDLNLIVSDTIITQNNIQYFEGEYGIGNQSDGICSSGNSDYFIDDVKAEFVRISENGLQNISHEETQGSKVQVFAGTNLPNYLNNYNYQFGGISSVIAVYNFAFNRDSEAIFILQGGTGGPNGTIPGNSLAYVEAGNRWTSFYDFVPDAAACCENQLYSFYNGVLYIHNNTTTYCNFYGTQYVPSITLVANDNKTMQKTFMSINTVSNVIWNSPLVYTDMFTYGSQRQESKLFDQYFKLFEAQYKSPFFKDIHSIGGIGNGNSLKGHLIVVQLQPTNGAVFSWLAETIINYKISPVLAR